MNLTYYYLVSSLPALKPGAPSPMSPEEFLACCRGQLADEEVAILENVSLEGNDEILLPVLRRWDAWMIYMRNVLARHRGIALGVDSHPFLRSETEVFPSERRIIEEILVAPNPAERQEHLVERCWHILDELMVGREFSLEGLAIYRLRLLLLRLLATDLESGKNTLSQLSDTLTQSAWEQRESHE